MKLYKILEIYNDVKKEWNPEWSELTPSNVRHISNKQKRSSHTMLGMGLNAYVGTEDNDNFGDVTRISNPNEATATYLTAIATNLPPVLRNNPYLPIIRRVRQLRTRTDITMERLIPFDTASIVKDNEFFNNTWHKCLTVPPKDPDNITVLFPLINQFAHHLHLAASRNNMTTIKDPKLQQVLGWIHSLHNTIPGSIIDIHINNLMWRPNKYGFQLVIIDPIT